MAMDAPAPAGSAIEDTHVLDDIFRSVARKSCEVTDFLCPITGLLMDDPVTAEDGFNYERSAIKKWFRKDFPPVSPQTGEKVGTSLQSNQHLRDIIKQFRAFVRNSTTSTLGSAKCKKDLTLTWKPHGMCREAERKVTLSREDTLESPMQMCQALSKFFKEFDPIEDLLYKLIKGLKAPKFVVIGDESAGKSTILEMLAMLPFFPRKRRCCTRMAIHLRMRRTPGKSRAILKVLSANLEVELSREIPQENGWLSVQAEMERLQKELFGGAKKEQIISEKIIEVRVERPDVPCLDLVDLPGMAQLPQEKAEQVQKIYQRQLQDDRESGNQCMYLAVVPASGDPRPANNPVMKFVIEEGLQDRTFGIFSKCDENSDADVLRALALHEQTEDDESPESVGAVALKNGWVCTMQKPPDGEYFKYHNYERMYVQQKQEMQWFQNPDTPKRREHWPRLVENKAAGIADLVPLLQNMYLDNLQKVWKEYAMLQIFEKEATVEFYLNMLGVVEDEDEKKHFARQEVSRRLGPDSEVTQNIYVSFVADVLNTKVVAEVRKILADFAIGQPCPGHEFPKLLQQKKEELLELMELVLSEIDRRMLDGVRDILLAKSVICKDGPSNFNIQTASLRLYRAQSCRSQWEVQEKLKAEPIIQLCHFRGYVAEIMKKHREMLGRCKQNLRGSLETLINRLFDVDFPSPYLEVKSSFLSQKDHEKDYTDGRVIISCNCTKFLNDFLPRCLQHTPHPSQLQNLHEDIPIGCETKEARAEFDRLKKELRLVKTARESIERALAIEDVDLKKIKNTFEVEQDSKVELIPALEDFPQENQLSTDEAAPAATASAEHLEEAQQPTPQEVKTIKIEDDIEKADLADGIGHSADSIVTPSGSGSWDPVTSQSTPTSEGFCLLADVDCAEAKDQQMAEDVLPAESKGTTEASSNAAPKPEGKESRKQKRGKTSQ